MNTHRYLKLTQGTVREQHIAKWKELLKLAEDEARKLALSLKESRETKLFRKQKRTESLSNMDSIPPNKQPAPQQGNLIEALTGLLGSYSKNEAQKATATAKLQRKRPRKRKRIPKKTRTTKHTVKKRLIYRKNRHIHTHSYNHNHILIYYHSNPNPEPNDTQNSNQSDTLTDEKDDVLVILAKKAVLSETQKDVLRKGLTSIPKPKSLSIQTLLYIMTYTSSCIESRQYMNQKHQLEPATYERTKRSVLDKTKQKSKPRETFR